MEKGSVRYLVAEPLQELKYAVIYEDINPVKDSDAQPYLDIVDIRKIGPTSVLIKWMDTPNLEHDGYIIYVDGMVKSRVFSNTRNSCVVDALKPNTTNEIAIYATKNGKKCDPPTVKKYTLV